MVCQPFTHPHSAIHATDPRVRLVGALALCAMLAICREGRTVAAGLVLSAILVAIARLPWRAVARRLTELNVFMLLVWLTLPFSIAGREVLTVFGASASAEGFARALMITARGNAIVLAVTALVSTIDTVRLGQALHALHVPAKFSMLFLFAVRYLDLLHHESHRLTRAARARCFRPRANLHTFRTLGYFVGVLLVESFERSERVVAAMKCRGFTGRFPFGDPFRLARRDAVAALVAIAAASILGVMEWGW